MAKNKEITELTVTLLLPANEVPSRGRPPPLEVDAYPLQDP